MEEDRRQILHVTTKRHIHGNTDVTYSPETIFRKHADILNESHDFVSAWQIPQKKKKKEKRYKIFCNSICECIYIFCFNIFDYSTTSLANNASVQETLGGKNSGFKLN